MSLRIKILLSAMLVSVAQGVFAQNSLEGMQERAQEMYNRALRGLDPALVLEAEARGLYDREALPISRAFNPYYIRGDFNGDGELDVAFWVENPDTQQRGVAIVHSTLDRLYVFGAGQPRPQPTNWTAQMAFDGWSLIPAGRIVSSPYTDIPQIGLEEQEPFAFEHEALSFQNFFRGETVFYWTEGSYWEIVLAD